jgi:uncharacterized phiE125 gp8 family phage protein
VATGDLTTLTNVKTWLGLATTTDDTLLGRLITAHSAVITNYLGRQILANAYSEIRDGNNGRVLVLANTPIISITSLYVYDRQISQSLSYIQPGYTFDNTTIYLHGTYFTKGQQNVAVCYTAGYTTTPADIEQAVIELVATRYKERERIGLHSKGLAGETITYLVRDLPDDVKTILNPYRKVVTL